MRKRYKIAGDRLLLTRRCSRPAPSGPTIASRKSRRRISSSASTERSSRRPTSSASSGNRSTIEQLERTDRAGARRESRHPHRDCRDCAKRVHCAAKRGWISRRRCTASGGHTEARASERQAPIAGVDRDQDYYDAGFDAFWELDFFGRVRRGVEAQLGRSAGGRSRRLQHAGQRDGGSRAQLLRAARRAAAARGRAAQCRQPGRNACASRPRDSMQVAARSSTPHARRRSCRATLATIPDLEAAVTRCMLRLGVLTGQSPEALMPQLSDGAARCRTLPTTHEHRHAGSCCCVGGRTFASPSASSPPRLRESASRSAICSRASRSSAAGASMPSSSERPRQRGQRNVFVRTEHPVGGVRSRSRPPANQAARSRDRWRARHVTSRPCCRRSKRPTRA